MQKVKYHEKIWQDPVYFLAFGFGSGLAPIAPGTWGTVAAIPVYLLLMTTHWIIYSCCVIVAFFLGIWLCDKVASDIGVHDYPGIVWDEIVGFLATMFLVPKGFWWIVLGFILFRFFDVLKPEPIRYVDKKIQGGLGIMLDDLLAALPAWAILQFVAWSVA